MIHNIDLCQWDVGRTLTISDSEATHIHFANQGDSYAVIMYIDNGSVLIPNYLLQTGKALIAYAVNDGVTLESKTFAVLKRERPENYVYEEDRRNYIYELIENAENAINNANEAADRANEAADRAGQFAGDVEAVQKEVGDLRTEINALDGGFEPRVEKTVVENLENSGEIFGVVHAISVDVSEQSLYDAHLVENAENGEQIYHAEKTDNPHQVTAEQVGAVTKEQHDKDIKDAKDWAEILQGDLLEGIEELRSDVFDSVYTKTEVDAKIGNIETAIDSILAIQNELIGGDGV